MDQYETSVKHISLDQLKAVKVGKEALPYVFSISFSASLSHSQKQPITVKSFTPGESVLLLALATADSNFSNFTVQCSKVK